jgi:hypothetical protein
MFDGVGTKGNISLVRKGVSQSEIKIEGHRGSMWSTYASGRDFQQRNTTETV